MTGTTKEAILSYSVTKDFSNENTKVFVHRITCNGRKVTDRKVLYPFITVDGSNKAFYVYEGAIITLKFEE